MSTSSYLHSTQSLGRLPYALKLAYTVFMAVLIPVYTVNYGLTNFLYFCDVALLLTLVGVWRESALLVSMAAVGILLPQFLWCADFCVGGSLVGMTGYMFDSQRSVFLRGLSLFHGWLPFLLVFAVRRLGYDRRAFAAWSILAVVLCAVSYLWLPAPELTATNLNIPRNVNYVFGMSETVSQTWMSPLAYVVIWTIGLVAAVYLPSHLALRRWVPTARR
jgi:hypothetical protein